MGTKYRNIVFNLKMCMQSAIYTATIERENKREDYFINKLKNSSVYNKAFNKKKSFFSYKK